VGKDLFAIFATLQQLTAPGSYVMGAIGMAITPRLARAYANGRYAEFRKVLCYAIICVAVMGAAGLAFALVAGKWFLSTFFKPEYADYNGVLVWLVVAATLSFVAGILGFGATATRTFHRFVVPYLIISATALLGSALVVPRWEMFGAAMVFAAIQVVAAISFLLIMLWAGLGGRTADQ
jgi:O-antigen/teichoic acid export membrane protein